MQKLVIAVDCDDVLLQTTPYFVATYNKLYGTKTTLAQSQASSADVWGADFETLNQRWADMTQRDDYKQLGPSPQTAATLRELAKHHELHLVTARHERERHFTEAMLERELAGVFTDMHFVGWGNSKGVVCQAIGANVLVDDNATHLQDAIHHGLSAHAAILFGNYPWNEEYRQRNQTELVFCSNWFEVQHRVERLAGGSEGEPSGTTFRQAIETLMAAVPAGKVTTYGDIAALAGYAHAARIVGSIAHYGDPHLPWHRLVNRFGGLAAGYYGGRKAQAEHLAAEGITCTNDIVDNFEERRWRPL